MSQVRSVETENNKFRTIIYSRDNQANDLAQLLGFKTVEDALESLRNENPWSPQARRQLAEAQTRITQLEEEVAKHITASKDAHDLITELTQQIEVLNQFVEELNADIARLREDRTAARQEAERQAQEAIMWRTEVQTRLPEMQGIIRELQQQSRSPLTTQKENVAPAPVDNSPNYKQLHEMLEKKYNALLDTKNKISTDYQSALHKLKRQQGIVQAVQEKKKWVVQQLASEPTKSGKSYMKIKKDADRAEMSKQLAQIDDLFEEGKALLDGEVDDAGVFGHASMLEMPGNATQAFSTAVEYPRPEENLTQPSNLPVEPTAANPPPPPPSPSPAPLDGSLTEPSSSLPEQLTPKVSPSQLPPPVKDIHPAPPALQESVTEPSSSQFSHYIQPPQKISSSPKILVADSSPEKSAKKWAFIFLYKYPLF